MLTDGWGHEYLKEIKIVDGKIQLPDTVVELGCDAFNGLPLKEFDFSKTNVKSSWIMCF